LKDRFALAGSLVASVLASACCIGPLALGAVGLGSLGFGAAFAPFRPWFLGLTALFLVAGFYFAYRPRPAVACAADGTCATPSSRRGQRAVLWVVAALALGLATYPLWSTALASRPPRSPDTALAASTVSLEIQGMTCPACGDEIESALRKVPDVASVQVDYRAARAVIRLSAANPDLALLVAAVEKAGYRAVPAAR